MRIIFAILGLAAVLVVILMSLGMLSIQMQPGEMPSVAFDGGKAPSFDAQVSEVGVSTTNKTIQVPTITMENKTVQVPVLEVSEPQPVTATQ